MVITLGKRTEETVRVYFEKTSRELFRKVLPQKAKNAEEAVEDYRKTLLPGATSYGRTILADGRYVGDVWCYCIDPEDSPNAMVSYCILEPELWGQGIAAEGLRLFLAEIGEKFPIGNLGAFTFSENTASIRVLEKNGFTMVEEFEEDGVPSNYFERTL